MDSTQLTKITSILAGSAKINGSAQITDLDAFRKEPIDKLVRMAVFDSDPKSRAAARWAIKSAASSVGIFSASIEELYRKMGRAEIGGFTVPAINIRGMTYDVAGALFQAAMKNNAGAFIFEIAKSEIGYTYQQPDEYSTVIIAAAIKEGYRGPVFIQGDHFQVNAKNFKADREKEIDSLKSLIQEAVEGDFYNIDIDTSTLVDLSKPTLDEQQRLNYEVGAQLTAYLRSIEPKGITISVGGEIGEVGEQNSTPEELVAYMNGFNKTLAGLDAGYRGISKVSVQTGTSHGGVPLPDGSIAEVALDFDTLEKLGQIAKEKYGLCGAVQHGASTLPDEMFDRFPQVNTGEIHLATGFQNMIFDSSAFPSKLRERIYQELRVKFASERKEGQTDGQFIYKTRKKGFGLAKEEIWNIDPADLKTIKNELRDKFDFLFNQLKAVNNKEITLAAIDHPHPEASLENSLKWAQRYATPEPLGPSSPNED